MAKVDYKIRRDVSYVVMVLAGRPSEMWRQASGGSTQSQDGRFLWGNVPGDSDGKESACNAGDPGWIPGIPWRTAPHSCVLAWRISWTEEPDNL